MLKKSHLSKPSTEQLELPIVRKKEFDRNFSRGGRSFYFFDFDDNIAVLKTHIYLFDKRSGEQFALSSADFAKVHMYVGKSGEYKDFDLDLDDQTGSFRNFRDKDMGALKRWLKRKQHFEKDLLEALKLKPSDWQGPSWNCFYHAVFNHRPTAVITARGHHPQTIRRGIQHLVKAKFLPHEPNYLAIIPVSHPETRLSLGGEPETSVAQLKQLAIRNAVLKAFEIYGANPHHRFGMSDDDPKNIKLITEELSRLKIEFTENSFFVIETHKGKFIKREIFADHTSEQVMPSAEQLNLF